MKNAILTSKREVWVDNIKVFACVLVVLGHFFQSMTKAELLAETALYQWFNKSIYLFHVPLFFICSGYIYQKYSKIESFDCWWVNILKKLIALGIPYFTFSLTAWILKTMFSSSVNEQVGGLFQALLLKPIAPYWYLYCLFFLFATTPTFRNKRVATCALLVALVLKSIDFTCDIDIYAVAVTFSNVIWFVLGMWFATVDFQRFFKGKRCLWSGLGMSLVFVACSAVSWQGELSEINKFLLGLLACVAVLFLFGYFFKNNVQNRVFGFWAKYTMPIFLMHTIFAAGLRSILFKVGITNVMIHVVLGMMISFIGPIIAAEVMGRFKWMDIFLYPTKYIRIKNKRG